MIENPLVPDGDRPATGVNALCEADMARPTASAVRMAEPAGGIDVEERTTPVTTDGGDHERFAHYVKKRDILPSSVEGTPLEALCGKKWVPSRDPERFPICPECKEIYEGLHS